MRKGESAKTIPVISSEYILQPEETIKEKLSFMYGENLDFTNIYLYRLDRNNTARKSFLMKYQDPPEIYQVKEDHGGGLYLLMIQFNDPNLNEGAGGRNIFKTNLDIEGEPKKYTPDKPIIQNPAIPTTKEKLEEIKLLKDVFGDTKTAAAAGETSMMAMVVGMVLKMIDKMNTAPAPVVNTFNDKIMEVLLTKALDKSDKSELDMFKQVSGIIKDLGGSGESSEVMELIKAVAPAVLSRGGAPPPMALPPGSNGQAQQPRLNGPAALPAAVPPDVTIAINQLIENNNQLLNEVADLKKRMYYKDLSDEELEDFENAVNISGHEENFRKRSLDGRIKDIEDYNNWCSEIGIESYNPNVTELNKNNGDPVSIYGAILKNADEQTKIATLKQFYETSGHHVVYRWCKENGLLDVTTEQDSLIDYNTWCKKAGIPEYSGQPA